VSINRRDGPEAAKANLSRCFVNFDAIKSFQVDIFFGSHLPGSIKQISMPNHWVKHRLRLTFNGEMS